MTGRRAKIGGLAAAILFGTVVSEAAEARAAEGPSARPRLSGELQQKLVPGMADYTDNVLFGDVWLRPELAPRDRSLVTITALIAMGRSAQLQNHLGRAFDNGVSASEASGVLTHLAVYSGWPSAVSSLEVYDRVYALRGFGPVAGQAPDRGTRAAIRPQVGTELGAISPKFSQLTDTLVRDDLWLRADLKPRDRSLVTISALIAMGEMDGLPGEIVRGRANGLTAIEISETLTHLAFYVGWPRAERAIGIVAAMPATKR